MLNFNTIDKAKFGSLIKEAQFKELFNELGWDHAKKEFQVQINDENYNLKAIAEKKDFIILGCANGSGQFIPDSYTRRKIDNYVSKQFHEHLIIYTDAGHTKQIWQLAIKEPNKPIVYKETIYYKNQAPELLLQKLRGLLFNLEDEDKITLVDVKEKVTENFNKNSETVTKKFYVEFKRQHTDFLTFIDGIDTVVDKEWYASLMLNRLMFIYFIQKKGFLDNNINYLADKLKECSKKKGKDEFYYFYRNFLLVLFHKGLGSPERTESLKVTLGNVPYLNGGLFDVHELENKYKKIQIKDKAFENIFKFFDTYNWHLDNRITASGKDINPDVIGYIFEKYINDRAAMGAYYTKEDITAYISKNTIIPFLFDKVKKNCANAFQADSSIWKMLKDDSDRYIYDSVKKGTELKLPKEIEIGVDTIKPNLLERRKYWNRPADEKYALPTEIWREVVERRNRYFEIKGKIENDELREINDFITYNLDITQFAQDCIYNYEGSDFINSFYKAIKEIKILDPTCGSGAFLFAALNILEPLYQVCIKRMSDFIEEEDKRSGKRFPQFRAVVDEIEKHPSQKYYIFKNIILNNLYGVDIMKEAAETAKLRLFLKLVAEVEPDSSKDNMGLEPLPDIDFNIKSGNTLVGFTSLNEIEKACNFEEREAKGELIYDDETKIISIIKEKAEIVAELYNKFKSKQGLLEDDKAGLKRCKSDLLERLNDLNHSLNIYKAYEYGINGEHKPEIKTFNKWLETHRPFHWVAEFYGIMNAGGFDVIIGNPPYIEYAKVRNEYKIVGYESESCGNLYAHVMEKCCQLMNKNNCCGYIVQLPLICTDRMLPLQAILKKEYLKNYYASFDDRPAKLFDGLQHIRAVIFLGVNTSNASQSIMSTKYNRWYSQNRSILLDCIVYNENLNNTFTGSIPKVVNDLSNNIYNKLLSFNNIEKFMKGKLPLYYHNAPQYFVRVTDFMQN